MSKLIRVIILVAGLSMILMLAGFTYSDDPFDDLPPRPTSVPTAVPAVAEVAAPSGEKIQLHLENDAAEIPAGLWTAVEWQDGNGDWHVVEGWRGTLDTPTMKTWWVGDDMFGNGPFRWRLYASEGGDWLATSDLFHLPSRAGLMVTVRVMLD